MTVSINSNRQPETTSDRDLSYRPRTDYGNAERLVARHGHDLRYCPPLKSWFVWDGRRWQVDDSGEVMRRAKATIRAIAHEAQAADDDDDGNRADALRTWKKTSEAETRLKAMTSLASSERGMVIQPDDLDRNRMVFNVENGTLDLATGELRPHRRDDLLTLLAPVTFDPDATAPLWENFLSTVMGGHAELIDYLQRLVGYSMTGDIGEQMMPVLYGTGSNGKSTFITALLDLFGEYGQQAEGSTFLTSRGDRVRNDLAALRGSRFVSAVEVKAGSMFDETTVKQLTGGDRIRARFLYKEYFEYDPTFKVWLAVNHKPEIAHQDHAIWRRIRVIPFEVRIDEESKDKRLNEKLRAEMSGILNWALAGCLEWQRNGLQTPADVELETAVYQDEMDDLAEFFEQVCIIDTTAVCTKDDLYQAYSIWALQQGDRFPMKKKKLGMTLKERGYRDGKHGGDRAWFGIGLKEHAARLAF